MCSTQTTDIRPSFGDVVRLNGSRAGRVRFIGHTKFQKNTLLYGIHLKQAIGKHNGTINNIKYFKCPSNHGIFVSAENIIKIIKKHTASNISFYYNQIVKVSNIGIGRIRFIGMTNFGNNYWYGIKLKNEITKMNINNNCIHYLQQNQINIYFNATHKHSIFVRSNQLQSIINTQNNTKFNKKNLKLYMKSKSTNGEYKNNKKHKKPKNRKYKNISENEANITHVNESMVSMMNSLNIPKHSRDSLMGLKKQQKLLLIQQWFITPNHERRHSDPTTPINTVSNNIDIYESKSIDMGFDEYECCISNGKENKKKLKRKKKVIVKSVKNNRKDKKKKIIRNNNRKSKSKPRLKLKKDSSKQRSKTMMPKSNKHKKKHKHKKKIIKNKTKKKSPKYSKMSDDDIPKYKPIFRHQYSHSEEYYW